MTLAAGDELGISEEGFEREEDDQHGEAAHRQLTQRRYRQSTETRGGEASNLAGSVGGGCTCGPRASEASQAARVGSAPSGGLESRER